MSKRLELLIIAVAAWPLVEIIAAHWPKIRAIVKTFCVALAVLLGVVSAPAADVRFYRMTTNMGVIDQQTNWFYYGPGSPRGFSSDAPEGVYFGWLGSIFTTTPTNGAITTVQLGTNLPAGTYLFSVKAQMYDDAFNPDLTIFCGGGSNTVHITTVTNSGGNVIAYNYTGMNSVFQWVSHQVITTLATASTLTISLTQTNPLRVVRLGLIGVAVSTQTNDWINKFDYVGNFTPRTSIDTNPAPSGNLLHNSGFELGSAHWWSETGSGRTNLASKVNTAEFHSGATSLRIASDEAALSETLMLVPDTKYTVSAWLKGATAFSVKLGLLGTPNQSMTDPVFPPGYTNYTMVSNVTVTTSWARYSVEVNSYDYPAPEYAVRIWPQGATAVLFIDDVQIEAGGLTTYAPHKGVEFALVITNAMAAMTTNSRALLTAYNSTANSSNRSVAIKEYAWNGRLVGTATNATFTFPAGVSTFPINVNLGWRGLLRALTTSGIDQHEQTFLLVPQVQISTNSSFGTHATSRADPYYWRGETNANIGFMRGLSPAWDRFEQVQPTDDNFTWTFSDTIYNSITNGGLIPLEVVDYQSLAAFALDSGAMIKVSEWNQYVQLLSARRGNVAYEIKNEPEQAGLTPLQYVTLLTNATPIIRSNAPNALIVMMGGAASVAWCSQVVTNLTNVWGQFWYTNFQAASFHCYPPGSPMNQDNFDTYSNLVGTVGGHLPCWNTESGVKDMGPLLGRRGIQWKWDDSPYPQQRFTRGIKTMARDEMWTALCNFGVGFRKYFIYDGRLFANFFDHQYSHIEQDDSMRSKAAVVAAAASLIDGFNQSSNLTHGLCNMFAFGGGAQSPVVVAWSQARSNLVLGVNESLGALWVVDWHGNWARSASTNIVISDIPTYFISETYSFNDWAGIMKDTPVTLTTDTNPPNLIVLAPEEYGSGYITRFFAIDDLSNSDASSPSGVQYRYTLNGSPPSAWSNVPYVESATIPTTLLVQSRDEAGNFGGDLIVATNAVTVTGNVKIKGRMRIK